MDFREFMKKDGEEEPVKNPVPPDVVDNLLGEHSERSQQFETLSQTAIQSVETLWKQAKQDEPLQLSAAVEIVKSMIQFISKGCSGLLFFKTNREVPYYYLNVVNVTWFSLLIAKELNYSEEKNLELGLAAFLHDIGMSKIDPDILVKKGKLSFDEYELIRQHTEKGKQLLSDSKELSEATLLGLFQEHERENGSGYPEGRRGNQVHEFAKIIGLSDVFEAMTHYRDYRDSVSANEAILEILTMKGRLFHQKYITSFINAFTFYPVGSYVQLNTNEVGRVIDVNRETPTRPIMELLIDKEGLAVVQPQFLNLNEKDLIFVKEALTEEKVRFALEGNA